MQRLVNLAATSLIAAGAAMFVLGIGSVMADEEPPINLADKCNACLTTANPAQPTADCTKSGEFECKNSGNYCQKDARLTTGQCVDEYCLCQYNSTKATCECKHN